MLLYLLHEGSNSAHILIRRVGAGSNKTILDLQRPGVGLGGLTQLRDGGGKVGGEGTVDVGLQGAQVNFDNLK